MLRLLPLAAVPLLVSGCIYEELPPCPDPAVVNVRFEWRGAVPESVKGMNLYFYPIFPEGHRWQFNIPSPLGGSIEIPIGSYRVIAYNADTRGIDFINSGDFSSFFATTLPPDARPDSTGCYPAAAPERLWSASLESVQVNSGDTIILYPHPRVPIYNVILEDVDNLSAARSITASINGLSGGCLLNSGKKISADVTSSFTMHKSGVKGAFGQLLNFGYLPSEPQTLTLLFQLNQNRMARLSQDVSQTIRDAADPFNVDIILRGLRVPDTGDTGQDPSTDVSVAGWEIITTDWDVDPFHP